ncbi:HAD family hydrolase [Actinacidiphila sp. ITFR-21]|uniref:HAD family hydrolase n=1 Tax=Actinacidiphila sp. ITFR-21 TaxID=3075199 RepID=UPI0028892BCF|nr:HAD family hydrolase [Streptomyces sp. ITFR-21]WNI17021.1 HAD family hydrolase [Streptomyces sp. ITFR-21]
MTSAYHEPSLLRLRARLARAKCRLPDFDGPVCHLFRGYPAGEIAQTVRDRLAERGSPVTDPALLASTDPLAILRSPRGGLAAELQQTLAEAEETAVRSAEPTPPADVFIRAAAGSGRRLAVTRNNAPAAVRACLREHDLDDCFGGRIHGRSAVDAALLKPHPDCLLRAVDGLAVRPSECLMIGDPAGDAAAATAARCPSSATPAAPTGWRGRERWTRTRWSSACGTWSPRSKAVEPPGRRPGPG